jgi:hypothetical protein
VPSGDSPPRDAELRSVLTLSQSQGALQRARVPTGPLINDVHCHSPQGVHERRSLSADHSMTLHRDCAADALRERPSLTPGAVMCGELDLVRNEGRKEVASRRRALRSNHDEGGMPAIRGPLTVAIRETAGTCGRVVGLALWRRRPPTSRG